MLSEPPGVQHVRLRRRQRRVRPPLPLQPAHPRVRPAGAGQAGRSNALRRGVQVSAKLVPSANAANFLPCPRAIAGRLQPRREAMHVQSVSHWAPANIGPYSQAVQVMKEAKKQGKCSAFLFVLLETVLQDLTLWSHFLGFRGEGLIRFPSLSSFAAPGGGRRYKKTFLSVSVSAFASILRGET